jgi:hypothetical protein
MIAYKVPKALFTLTAIGVSAIAPNLARFLMPPAVAQSRFPDIQNHWAQSCIEQLAAQEIISGYPDGTFRPEVPVTRAEFAAFVNNAFPDVDPVRGPVQFVDVTEDYWASEQIQSAYRKGFMSGYPYLEFRPTQEIPRVQTFVALASGLNYRPDDPTESILNRTYVDAGRIPEYAQEQIAGATQAEIVVNPVPNRHWLDPEPRASRGQVAASICQALPALPSVPSAHISEEDQFAARFGIIQKRDEYDLILTENIPDSPQINATPEEAAKRAFGLDQRGTGGAAEQEVDDNFIEPNKAIVMLTQTTLPDDSVRDVRYRVEVALETTPAGDSWEIVWAGRQHRCEPGRGPQEWTTATCL